MARVRDPVCGMTIDQQDAVATSTYKEKTYYFCSEDCKVAFDEAPEDYAGRVSCSRSGRRSRSSSPDSGPSSTSGGPGADSPRVTRRRPSSFPSRVGARPPSTPGAASTRAIMPMALRFLAGFAGKPALFGAVIEAGCGWLAAVAALNTVVSLAYHGRVMGPAFFRARAHLRLPPLG